ncbi:MAG TPA: hypothetical protein GXZ82_06800 [Firmicutes bacterium]|nr:hypothetical protein [Bacillota bacterium]
MGEITNLRSHELWTAELEKRLIEMYRAWRTMEEMARELSLPIDEIEARLEILGLEDNRPERYP